MNNKGFIGFITIFVLLMVIMVLALAQNKVDSSTINQTIETLNWSKIGQNVTMSIQRSADNSPSEIAKVVLNVANKAVDFFGYTIFELTKLAMEFARDNPDFINWRVLLTLILLSLIAPLIYPAWVVSISIIIFIKEWIVQRRYKKEMERLRHGN